MYSFFIISYIKNIILRDGEYKWQTKIVQKLRELLPEWQLIDEEEILKRKLF